MNEYCSQSNHFTCMFGKLEELVGRLSSTVFTRLNTTSFHLFRSLRGKQCSTSCCLESRSFQFRNRAEKVTSTSFAPSPPRLSHVPGTKRPLEFVIFAAADVEFVVIRSRVRRSHFNAAPVNSSFIFADPKLNKVAANRISICTLTRAGADRP